MSNKSKCMRSDSSHGKRMLHTISLLEYITVLQATLALFSVDFWPYVNQLFTYLLTLKK